MKSQDQILLENAYARTYGIRKIRDSEIEQMIENIKLLQSKVDQMHHLQLNELKQHLEQTINKIDSRLTSSNATNDLAKKHNVSVEEIEKELADGIKVEQEHTDNLETAKKIALDHLSEDPKYYTKLVKAKL